MKKKVAKKVKPLVKKKKAKKKVRTAKKRVKAKAKKKVKAVKKTRKPKKAAKSEGPKLLNIKLEDADKRALMARAKKYTKGNLSVWIRVAGKNHIPKKAEIPDYIRVTRA